jgi:phospholipid/cholesterol/gamma-HCH transport system substrate-binding protein
MSFALPQSFKTTPQEKMVGIFVFVAIAAFIYLSTLKSSLSGNDSSFEYSTQVKQSYGITLRAPVRLSGVVIGEVSSIELLTSGKVSITISLPYKYRQLYTLNSTLKIDSQLGFDTMLSGQGLIFQPGSSSQLLKSGAVITTHEPQTLADLTKEFDLAEISRKISSVLDNFEKISDDFVQKNDEITQILNNANRLIEQLNQTSAKLPAVLDQFEGLLANIDKKSMLVFDLAAARLTESEQVMVSGNALLQQLTKLGKMAEPVVEDIPTSLAKVNTTLMEIDLLTKQLKGLWYLGGKETSIAEASGQIRIPYFDNKVSLKDLGLTEQNGEVNEQRQN